MSLEMREKRLPEREGVIFLIYKDGKVFLEERTMPVKAYTGYTIIPGGKFEKGVDLNHDDAVRREFREECGDVKITKMILLDNYLQTTITNHLYSVSAYLITDYEGEITNPEGKSKHIWVDINVASEHLLFADSRYIVLLAKQQLLRENS
jgi:8-oxo-dGTP pyrophosphatase MutT (NUDIX family)